SLLDSIPRRLGTSGPQGLDSTHPEEIVMKRSIADQIKDLENTRAAKEARMLEVSSKAADEGRTMDDAEAEEFDTLEAEVKAVDADIARFRKLEQLQAAKAQPVAPKSTTGA